MSSFCASVWNTKTKLFVKASLLGLPLFSPFDRMKKCGFSYFALVWWVLIKIVSIIQGFKRLTSFVFPSWLPEMWMKTEMPHTHFCKRKKEKKESRLALWRVSKKQVFRIKYYPYASWIELMSELLNWKCMGGDFIRNRRLELAFLNTRNKSLASFLSFFL